MGLLDEFSSFVKTPEGQGLLSAAFGGLATARRGEPINSMGKAGLAGLMGYGQAQDRIEKNASLDMQKQVQQMQLDKAKQEAADAAAQRTFFSDPSKFMTSPASQALAGGEGPTAENAAKIPTLAPTLNVQNMYGQLLSSGNPALAMKAIEGLAKQPEDKRYTVGNTLVDASGKQYFTAPPSGKLGTEDVHIGGGRWQAFKVGRDGEIDMNAPIGQAFLKRPTASDVNVSANAAVPKGDTKYAEKRMSDAAEGMTALTKSAESAYKGNKSLDRFLAASNTGTQGGAQPIITGVQNFLSSFGYAPSELKDVRQMEQAIGDMLGRKMEELGARGLTDKDMEVLRESLPRVNTDRAARENIVRILKVTNNNIISEWEGQRSQEFQTYPELSKRIPEPVWYKEHKNAMKGITPKTATMADIQETARKSGKSTAEVTAAMKAQGYTIGGN